METGASGCPRSFKFPLIVKPNAEGSSKGIARKSVVDDEEELREVARELIERTASRRWSRSTSPGREFTVGLLGDKRPRVLPPMEIVFIDKSDTTPGLRLRRKQEWEKHVYYECPAKLDAEPSCEAIERAARDDLRGARLPRRRARRPAHGRRGRASTSSSATRCPASRRTTRTSC